MTQNIRTLVSFTFGALALVLAGCSGSDGSTPGNQQGNKVLACGSQELHAAAHDGCAAMDAIAMPDENGDCLCELGYAWDGDACVALANCQCQGADCDKLSQTQAECEQAHTQCGGGTTKSLSCGDPLLYSVTDSLCAPMDAAGAPDENGDCLCMLGFAWNGSECTSIGNCKCVGADCNKLTETQEQCEAAHQACGG